MPQRSPARSPPRRGAGATTAVDAENTDAVSYVSSPRGTIFAPEMPSDPRSHRIDALSLISEATKQQQIMEQTKREAERTKHWSETYIAPGGFLAKSTVEEKNLKKNVMIAQFLNFE